VPVFTYQALDKRGAEVVGTINADNDKAAFTQVQGLGYHPLEIKAGGRAASSGAMVGEIKRRGRRVKLPDLTLFTRQLANLVRGGLPMMRTLDALVGNTENARLYQILSQVRDDVSHGESLCDALGKHPRVFPPLYLSLVAAGEASGDLGPVLERLATFLEMDLERRTQIRSALMYPILLLSVGSLIVFALVTFLIPKFKELFDEFDRALPLTTQIVLGLSDFLSQWWWAVFLALGLLYTAHKQWLRTERGRLIWDRSRLRWPILGRLFHRAASARLARTLATLLHGGVNILDALTNVEGVVDNAHLASAIRQMRDGVREGESLGLETRKTGQFPGLLSQMMLVGEETGDVEGALNTVADAFDVEVTNSLKGLVALVEPLIILVMGGLVALVVFAMLTPIFEMSSIVQ